MNTQTRRADNPAGFKVFGDIDTVLNGIFTPQRVMTNKHSMLNLVIDVVEKEAAYDVIAEIPGVNLEDIDVTIDDGVLTIEAQSMSAYAQDAETNVIRNERRYGKYSRSIKLGKLVDENSIQANYNAGVLTITLAKLLQAKPKKISINA